MTRQLRRLALLSCVVAVAALLTTGALRLDERYLATRFQPAVLGQCPLAVARTTGLITPMCSAMPGW